MFQANLIYYPDKKLCHKSKMVKNPNDPEIQKLIVSMIEIMRQKKGVGISAVQVNIPLRITIIEYGNQRLVLINPKIYKKSFRKNIDIEGCLSVPGVFGPVKRSFSIKVRAVNEKNKKINLKAEGPLARIIQHEVDHTEGILFIDKMINSEESKKTLKRLRDLKKNDVANQL